MGEKRAALICVSGSEAAFAILGRVVVFPAFCVMGGRRTRVRREAFGGIFFRVSRSYATCRGPKQDRRLSSLDSFRNFRKAHTYLLFGDGRDYYA